MVIFQRYVSLPEGNLWMIQGWYIMFMIMMLWSYGKWPENNPSFWSYGKQKTMLWRDDILIKLGWWLFLNILWGSGRSGWFSPSFPRCFLKWGSNISKHIKTYQNISKHFFFFFERPFWYVLYLWAPGSSILAAWPYFLRRSTSGTPGTDGWNTSYSWPGIFAAWIIWGGIPWYYIILCYIILY